MSTRLLLLIITTSFLCGCIKPPDIEEPAVIDPKELKLVSLMQRGKENALIGRFDEAEILLRKAHELDPDNPTLLNDLGYVLHSQLRYREALVFYQKAIRLKPRLIEARQNEARVHFDLGNYDVALLLYHELERMFVRESKETGVSQLAYLAPTYRNIAQIHYLRGNIDDAVCYSSLTFVWGQGVDVGEMTQHVRMLMSIGKISEARELLKRSFAIFPQGMPIGLLLDYGIVLYYEGDFELAGEAFSRILSKAQSFGVRRVALLFKYLLTLEKEEDEEAEFIFTSLLEEDSTLCEDDNFDVDGYWPDGLAEEFSERIAAACDEAD